MNSSNFILEIIFIYGFLAVISIVYIYMKGSEVKRYKSSNIICFDEFNATYRISASILFVLMPVFFICAEINQKMEVEGLIKDGVAALAGSLFNSFLLLHSFNKKIFIFKEYFLISNFLGFFQKIYFSDLKNSKEFYTDNFGEGYVFQSEKIKIKIPKHFDKIKTTLKIIRENKIN